ncbi:MAG: hypothetical protein ACE15D_10510 [Candidatus Eisenbacteria bacterium]
MGRLLLPLSILLVVAFSIPSNALAIPPDTPSFLSSTLWSNPNSVRVLDDKAYVVYPNGLAVFDASDPTAPVLLGRTYSPGWLSRLELMWPYAFVGSTDCIRIFDINDPKSPRQIGRYPVSGELADFAFAKNLAYIEAGDYERTLEIVDFSDPTAPTLLGSCAAPGFTIALAGEYVYMPAYHDGVFVIDVSDPRQPHVAGRWEMGIFSTIRVHGDRAYCIWISGEKVQGEDGEDLRDDSGVMVYDISQPLEPVYLGEYRAQYNVEWVSDIYFDCGLAYLTPGPGTALILDFADPANPLVVGNLVTQGDFRDLDFLCGTMYVADGRNGLVSVDVSDPAEPSVLGSWWEASYPSGISVDDRAAYIADGIFGLHVLDVHDPLHPVVISRLPMVDPPDNLVVAGDYAFCWDNQTGVDVIDVADLDHPEPVAHMNVPASGLALAGDVAYVVRSAQFTSIDISDPGHPAVLGGCAIPPYAGYDVCTHGDLAYVANGDAGLVIVDVSDPAHPFRRGTCDLYDRPYNVVTDGSVVYASLSYYKLGVFDVTNPDQPYFVREIVLPGGMGMMRIVGDRLFVDATPGIRVYDISDPRDPIEVGSTDVIAGRFDIRGPFLYLVGGGSFVVLGPAAANAEAESASLADLRVVATDPVSAEARIRVHLRRPGNLTVSVFDVAGRLVATLFDGFAEAGEHSLRWTPGSAAAGVYFVRAESQGRSASRMMHRIR